MAIKVSAIAFIKDELECRYKIGIVTFRGVQGCIECGSMENVRTLLFEVIRPRPDDKGYEEEQDFEWLLCEKYAEPVGYKLDIKFIDTEATDEPNETNTP